MENKLNEKNLQLAFNFNASNGILTNNRITGEILLEETNQRIAIQESSEKIAVDLGYSIDGDIDNMLFTLDSERLSIKIFSQRWDLVETEINENEAVIITDEPSFKTCLWLNKKGIGKILNFQIISQNTSISSWMFDIIAKKVNGLNLDDITDLEESVTTLNENIEIVNTSLTTLNNDITELKSSAESSGGEIPEVDINGYSILRQKKLEWRPKTSDYGSFDSWYGLYSDVDIIRYSNGTTRLTGKLQLYNTDNRSVEKGKTILACVGCPVKLGKIYSIDFVDRHTANSGRTLVDLKMAVFLIEDVENAELNDPNYGGFDIMIRNLAPYIIGTSQYDKFFSNPFYINILFDLPESYITNYDYIL